MSARALLLLSALTLAPALAQRVGDPTNGLDKLSPGELFSVQVTGVGRKAEPLSKAAAAVFVLTADDIRRSGATSTPEALQWVPGLTVLSVDGRSWVIPARGGARLYADKMLVMIDGRSLYTPLFSGVLWDSIGVPMEERWQTSDRNEFYFGVGYQQYWDDTISRNFASFDPASSTFRDGDIVVQDELELIPGRLPGSAGVRLDYSSYHRWEYQPSLRLMYTPSERQSVWMAASRAVRMPSRLSRDARYAAGSVQPPGFPLPIAIYGSGSTAMRSEVERSLEAGYRVQSGQRRSLDSSFFWSCHTRLQSILEPLYPQVTVAGNALQLAYTGQAVNAASGRSYRAEVWGTWQISPAWRLIPSYSYLNEVRWAPAAAYCQYLFDGQPATLPHQGSLRSQFNWGAPGRRT